MEKLIFDNGERPDRRRGRKQGGERVAAVGGGRRSKDRGHPPGTATGIRHLFGGCL